MKTVEYKLSGQVALEIQAASTKHPNTLKFSGVLVRIDEASTKAPHGSDGHKILIPRSLASAQLKTLINMPVNYHPDLNQHQPSRAVGVIKAAKIVGNDLIISGVIWKKNFPSASKDLASSKLGMSFEAANISVQDKDADVWTLSGMCFTGATILYKDAAAYRNTSAALAAAASSSKVIDMPFKLIKTKGKGATMATKAEKLAAKKMKAKKEKAAKMKAAEDAKILAAAVKEALNPVVAAIEKNTQLVQDLASSLSEGDEDDLSSAGEDDEDEEDDAKAAAKKKKKPMKKSDDEDDTDDDDEEDDDEDMTSSEDDDEDDLEDLGDDEDDEDEPGSLNDKGKVANKGKSVTPKPAGKKGKVDAAAIDRLIRQNRQLRRKIAAQEEAIEAAASNTERRSISASAVMAATLAKGNLDVATLVGEGQTVSIADLDTMSAAAGLTSVQSMALKNEATRLGILEG